MDALHVIAGVLLQLAGVLLWRRGLASARPLAVVAGLATLNEVHDLWFEQWPSWGMQLGEGVKDLLLTLALPTVLMVLARRLPDLLLPGAPADYP